MLKLPSALVSSSMLALASSNRSASRSAIMTEATSCKKSFAAAKPIPPAAPVMKATLFSNLLTRVSLTVLPVYQRGSWSAPWDHWQHDGTPSSHQFEHIPQIHPGERSDQQANDPVMAADTAR